MLSAIRNAKIPKFSAPAKQRLPDYHGYTANRNSLIIRIFAAVFHITSQYCNGNRQWITNKYVIKTNNMSSAHIEANFKLIVKVTV